VSAHRSRGIGWDEVADLDITAKTDIPNDGFAKRVSGASNDRLASLPMVTRTSTGIPGNALNVGLVGSKEDVLRAMHASGWFPADPITLRTSIEIVGSVVLDRIYHDTFVSPLYYKGGTRTARFRNA
jgi:hypothetical protein